MTAFAALQAAYAAHRIVTYPLKENKTPAVRAYDRIGAPYSAQLAMRFPDATAAGFVAGPRNRVTVVDIDSADARLVDECLDRFGPTPLQILTPSGGRHLYYRHNGETRRIRPLPDVDILGGGNVVAALSVMPKGQYELERGTLDDLDRLPRLASSRIPPARPERVPEGKRNAALHRYCRSIVGHCDDLETLVDAARTWAEDQVSGRLPDAEIIKTAGSVWRFRGGRKLFMQHIVEGPKFTALVATVDTWALCSYLMVENGPEAEFMIADGLGEARGWPRRFVPAARKALLELGIVKCVRPSRRKVPALYRWVVPHDDWAE
jgi:Bifunctional DNA primase/polymerase, N-terminal